MRARIAAATFCALLVLPVSAAAQNVVVIRHGEADHNVNKVFNSHLDTPPSNLTAKGKDQAQSAGRELKEKGYGGARIALVLVSPLPRTRQTAEIVMRELGVDAKKLVLEPGVIECDMGKFEGKSLSETAPYFQNADIWNFPRAREFGAETSEDVARRVKVVVDRLRAAPPAGDVLIVTHGTPAEELLVLLGISRSKDTRLKNAEFRILPLSVLPMSKPAR
jgi:probable phosphoglycerate mutase